jgi:predicted Zn finger-like uncharacterized protein
MADEKFTRCPGCRTIFRVTPQQLALRNGQVRCGHCRAVFDGVAALVSLAPTAHMGASGDDPALGPPTVTLRSAQALEPAPSPGESKAAAAEAKPQVDYQNRFAWDVPRERSRVPTAAGVVAATALVAILVVQVFYHFRDSIAAYAPSLRPLIVSMCSMAGCEIRPLRDIGWLSIEASELQADPAHRGLLILASTLRNRAPHAVAHPYLELTLTDSQDRVVVRRAISPVEYLPASVAEPDGIRPQGEVSIKLFIDASATTQAGYRLYLFYP